MMMRSVYTSACCTGHQVMGIGVLQKLREEQFEKAAKSQGLRPGRRSPAVTNMGKYVDRRSPALARRLRKELKSWAKKISDVLVKEYGKIAKADDDVVKKLIAQLKAGGMAEDLLDKLAPFMKDSFKRGSSVGLSQVGISATRSIVNQMDEKALEYTQSHGAQLIKELSDTTLDDMQRVLGRAIENGFSTDDLADAIMDSSAFGEARAEMIARTELGFAHVQGNVEGWRESGEVVGKQAILGDLHDVPDICDECADVGVVGMDDDFVPGYDYPPFHPNCICDVIPILSEE
jgi:hypothetical protein